MLKRFFCPHLTKSTELDLETKEAHHAFSVMRLKKGEVIELFDGKGNRAEAKITALSKKQGKLERSPDVLKTPPSLEIHVGLSVPHRGKLDSIAEKCEELGVRKLILLKTERTVFDFKRETFEKLLTRLGRIAIESAKQSRHDFLMEVDGWLSAQEIAETFSRYERVLLMSPSQRLTLEPLQGIDQGKRPILILIGPEGGLSLSEEESFQQAGAQRFGLGDTLLKCDTATVSAVSIVKFCLEKKINGN